MDGKKLFQYWISGFIILIILGIISFGISMAFALALGVTMISTTTDPTTGESMITLNFWGLGILLLVILTIVPLMHGVVADYITGKFITAK